MTHFTSPHDGLTVAWTVRLGRVDPLGLARAWGLPDVYWEQRARGRLLAGWGAAATLQTEHGGGTGALLDAAARSLPEEWAGEPVRPWAVWLGGLAFHRGEGTQGLWPDFPAARFVAPSRMVWTQEGEAFLTAFGATPEEARGRACPPEPSPLAPAPPARLPPVRRLEGDRAHWEALHRQALAAFAVGALEKVVLARAVDVEAEAELDVGGVLGALREDAARGTLFCFRAPGGSTFLGLTPETLVRVAGRTLHTEALAGTAPAGHAQGLLEDERIGREHRAVVDGIVSALQPLTHSLRTAEGPALLSLRDVVHLHTPVEGTLREGVGLAEVVDALHPTPATGGTPRAVALDFLQSHEGLARGWYAAPLGWVGPEGAELVVGLRSALLQGRRARLFVGAGVVAGSTAQGEWEETEVKARPMLRALGGVHAG